MREAGGIERDQQSLQGALTRWTIDMSQADPHIEERPLGPPGDLPRLADVDQGRPYNRAWYLSMNPQGGPPMLGGPVGVNFNALMRIEPGNGRLSVMGVPPGAAISEPAHVPSSDPAHGGWLLMVVDIPTPAGSGPRLYSSELWVVEPDEVGKAHRQGQTVCPAQPVHGAWVRPREAGPAQAEVNPTFSLDGQVPDWFCRSRA